MRIRITFAALAVLSACGGGGSSTQNTEQGAYAVETAATTLLTTGRTFTTTAPDGTNSWTLTQTFAPQADASFLGEATKVVRRTTRLSMNGAELAAVDERLFFTTDPVNVLGSEASNGEQATYVQSLPFPHRANIGGGGTLYTYSTTSGSGTIGWSLEQAADPYAHFCLNLSRRDATTNRISTESDCYRIDDSGSILGAKFVLPAGGRVLTFQ